MSNPAITAKPHHYQLRNKAKQTFLTYDDLFPDREDETHGDTVAMCLEEEKAHDFRFKYEQEFASVGAEVEIEVVAFNAAGHEIGVS